MGAVPVTCFALLSGELRDLVWVWGVSKQLDIEADDLLAGLVA
jgi:hypothetical protein